MDCTDRRDSDSGCIALCGVIAITGDGDGVPTNTKYDGVYLAKADTRNTATGVLLRGSGEFRMMRRSLVAGVSLEESPRVGVLAEFLIDGDTHLLSPRGSAEGPTRAEAIQKISEEFPIGNRIYDNDPIDAELPQWRTILKNHIAMNGKVTITVPDENFEQQNITGKYAVSMLSGRNMETETSSNNRCAFASMYVPSSRTSFSSDPRAHALLAKCHSP